MNQFLAFLLQNRTSLNEKSFITEVLPSRKILLSGFSYFKQLETKTESVKLSSDITNLKLLPEVESLILEISLHLNLHDTITHSFFVEFLSNSPDLDDSSLKQLSHPVKFRSVLLSFREFYFSERLALLRLFKLSFVDFSLDWFDVSDLLQSLVLDVAMKDWKKFFTETFEHLKFIWSSTYKPNKTLSFLEEEVENRIWIEQQLKEVEEILMLMLFMLESLLSAQAPEILKNQSLYCEIIQFFKQQQFSVHKEFGCSVADCPQLAQRISFLAVIISVRIVHPLSYLNKSEDLDLFFKVESLLIGCQSQHKYVWQGPLLLLAALVRDLQEKPCEELADIAIRQTKVFSYLKQNLALFQSMGLVSLVLQANIFDLLTLLCSRIHLDSLGEVKSDILFLIGSLLPAALEMARPLQPLVQLLEQLVADIPVDLTFLNICSALAKEDAASDIAAQLFDNLLVFTEDISKLSEKQVSVLQFQGPTVTTKNSWCPIKGIPDFVLPPGSTGILKDDNIVSWQLDKPIYLWDILKAEINFYHKSSVNQLSPETLSRFTEIVTFTRRWIDKSLFVEEGIEIARISLLFLSKYFTTSQRTVTLLVSVLQLVGSSAKYDADYISLFIQKQRVCPVLRYPYLDDGGDIEGFHLEPSLVSFVQESLEMSMGTYPVLAAYYDILVSLVPAVAESGGILLAGILYTTKIVLPQFQTWKYQDPVESAQVASMCLLFLHEVLSIPEDEDSPKIVSTLKSLCLQLLHNPVLLTVTTQLVTLPVSQLIKETELNSLILDPGKTLLARVVWLALCIVNRLIPSNLSDSLPLDADDLTRTLLTYSWFYGHTQLTRMSFVVLRKLVPFSKTSCMSLVGEHSKRITQALRSRLTAEHEPVVVRSLILDFLVESILCGKTSLLNGMVDLEDAKSETVKDNHCCLKLVLNLVSSADNVPLQLLSSAVQFLSSLWVQNCSFLVKKAKQRGQFWDHLASLVSKEWQDANDRVYCRVVCSAHVLGIVSIELLACVKIGWSSVDSELQKTVLSLVSEKCVKGVLDMLSKVDTDRHTAVAAHCELAAGLRTFLTILTRFQLPQKWNTSDMSERICKVLMTAPVGMQPHLTACLHTLRSLSTDHVDTCLSALSKCLETKCEPAVSDLIALLIYVDKSHFSPATRSRLNEVVCSAFTISPVLVLTLLSQDPKGGLRLYPQLVQFLSKASVNDQLSVLLFLQASSVDCESARSLASLHLLPLFISSVGSMYTRVQQECRVFDSKQLPFTRLFTLMVQIACNLLSAMGQSILEEVLSFFIASLDLILQFISPWKLEVIKSSSADVFDACKACAIFVSSFLNSDCLWNVHLSEDIKNSLLWVLGVSLTEVTLLLSNDTPPYPLEDLLTLLKVFLELARPFSPLFSNLASLSREEVVSLAPVTSVSLRVPSSTDPQLSLGLLLGVAALHRGKRSSGVRESSFLALSLLLAQSVLHLHRLPNRREKRALVRELRAELSLLRSGGSTTRRVADSHDFISVFDSYLYCLL